MLPKFELSQKKKININRLEASVRANETRIFKSYVHFTVRVFIRSYGLKRLDDCYKKTFPA